MLDGVAVSRTFLRLGNLAPTVFPQITRTIVCMPIYDIVQIFFRMNELDDMLDLVQQGSVGISEIKAQQSNLHSQVGDSFLRLIFHLHKPAPRDTSEEHRCLVMQSFE